MGIENMGADPIVKSQVEHLSTGLIGMLGIEFLSFEPGRVVSRMKVTDDLIAPNGYLHATSILGLSDATCGIAATSNLPEGKKSFATIEIKSNFMGTLREGYVRCEAVAQHMGGSTQVWDATVTAEDTGKKLALFRCTQMLL